MTATEYIVLVDAKDREIGTAEKLQAHQNNLLHRAFSVFIYRTEPRLEILLQQRAGDKYHCGGLWTNTCCSHPHPGEAVVAAGQRRLEQELGFTAELTDIGWFHYNVHFENGLAENENDHVLIGSIDDSVAIKPNPNEVQAVRWAAIEDVEKEYIADPDLFTPWFRQALFLAKIKMGGVINK